VTNQGRESRDRLMAAGVVTILERFARCALRITKAALSSGGADVRRSTPTHPNRWRTCVGLLAATAHSLSATVLCPVPNEVD